MRELCNFHKKTIHKIVLKSDCLGKVMKLKKLLEIPLKKGKSVVSYRYKQISFLYLKNFTKFINSMCYRMSTRQQKYLKIGEQRSLPTDI